MLTEKQKEVLSEYKYDRNIVFVGDVGVGKTYEAIKILNGSPEALKFKITDSRFKELLTGGNLRLRRPEEWQSGIDIFPLEMCVRSGVLLYDDIGVADISEAYLRKLTFVLDERIERKLPTIFTTNLSPEDLQKKLDERIKSRIFMNALIVKMEGEDRRKSGVEIV